MAGLSPKIPLLPSQIDGNYGLTKNMAQVIKQNFKNLILTVPGERIMIPNFGVGLLKYLFEPNTGITYAEIEGKIEEQVDIYMPYLSIDKIVFSGPGEESDMDRHALFIKIRYSVPNLSITDLLTLSVSPSTTY